MCETLPVMFSSTAGKTIQTTVVKSRSGMTILSTGAD